MIESDNLVVEPKCHISLSKTFTLRYHQIEPFIELLGNLLKPKIK